jgi:hypothetical protein
MDTDLMSDSTIDSDEYTCLIVVLVVLEWIKLCPSGLPPTTVCDCFVVVCHYHSIIELWVMGDIESNNSSGI